MNLLQRSCGPKSRGRGHFPDWLLRPCGPAKRRRSSLWGFNPRLLKTIEAVEFMVGKVSHFGIGAGTPYLNHALDVVIATGNYNRLDVSLADVPER